MMNARLNTILFKQQLFQMNKLKKAINGYLLFKEQVKQLFGK